jgi:S1-C subfamily serine protease
MTNYFLFFVFLDIFAQIIKIKYLLKMRKVIRNVGLLILTATLTGCATMLIPGKQSVQVSSKNPETTVYVNNEKTTKGKKVEKVKAPRGGTQVVLTTPDYKDQYIVMNPPKGKRAGAFYPLLALDVPASAACMLYFSPHIPWVMDFSAPGNTSYEKVQSFTPTLPYKKRAENDKYIDLNGVKYDIKDIEKDIVPINVTYSSDMNATIAKAEAKKQKQMDKKESKQQKKNKGKEKFTDKSKIEGWDGNISSNTYKTLKKMGYVDTVGVFSELNNTVRVEGQVKNLKYYNITGLINGYKKAKVEILWYIEDLYGQKIDSTKISAFSGDFDNAYLREHKDEAVYTVVKDAIENNFMEFQTSAAFGKYAKIETGISITGELLTLPRPTSTVKNLQDAGDASVIVKRKNGGHGSGFAITNDGYILTNYHVIAGKKVGKPEEVTVVLPTELELPATVVRFNEKTDLALLKIDRKMEKAFLLTADKKYKRHDDCYTIGAPKSIELGQSLSSGLISNERETKEKMYMQLNMSVSPGNSGGPIFDREGNLHGVIVSKLVGQHTEGVCFAVPSHLSGDYLNIKYK